MKRKKIWMLVGGALLIVIIGVAATRGDKGLPVQVTDVNRETITAKVSANGKVQAVAKVDISANIMGQVTRLAVKEGDFVKKGQFIMEIDPSRSRANADSLYANVEAASTELQSAEARFNQAKADFTRAEANRKAGIIAQADFEQQRTALTTATNTAQSSRRRVEQAKAELRGASVSLRYSTITAPMDGVVTARRIEQGETAVIGVQNQAGTVLVTISDMSKVEAELEVDEASIPNVKMGQNAQVRIDAYPNQVFDAVVTEVGGSPLLKISQNEATKFKVKVQMKNPPATIKPGLSAQADIYTGSRENALAIPLQALVMKEIKLKEGEKPKVGAPKEEEGVYVMEGTKTKFVPVKTGLLGELNVEITTGLNGGEKVITGPFRTLRDLKGGEVVRVEKARKSGTPGDDRKAN
ncbi:MAG: efflux RND transporter periplasmic adaptor subunit [Holophaga sp.]|nr:efflux RND transporter periplasmic adaptor subunit [Holophaga sp.]